MEEVCAMKGDDKNRLEENIYAKEGRLRFLLEKLDSWNRLDPNYDPQFDKEEEAELGRLLMEVEQLRKLLVEEESDQSSAGENAPELTDQPTSDATSLVVDEPDNVPADVPTCLPVDFPAMPGSMAG